MGNTRIHVAQHARDVGVGASPMRGDVIYEKKRHL